MELRSIASTQHAYLLQIHRWTERISTDGGLRADGTFYVAPRIFAQSYTIHAVIDRKCLPMIYILSGDKKGDTYEFIFDVIIGS